jgi:hypothetical protein
MSQTLGGHWLGSIPIRLKTAAASGETRKLISARAANTAIECRLKMLQGYSSKLQLWQCVGRVIPFPNPVVAPQLSQNLTR